MKKDEEDCQIDSNMKKLFLAHSHQIFHFCYHLTGNRMDAEDLFQDTFLTAWEKRDVLRNQASDSQIKNYLLGITTHLWKNHQRKRLRRNEIASRVCDILWSSHTRKCHNDIWGGKRIVSGSAFCRHLGRTATKKFSATI